MTLPVDGEVYRTLDRATPFFVVWLSAFALLTIVRIARHPRGRAEPAKESMIGSELPGLPLMLLHSGGFVLSLVRLDFVSALLFLWWGPGYVTVALTLLTRSKARPPIDWKPWARVSSWACKLSYVAFMAVYLSYGLVGIPFVFSAWIIHDQVKLAWLRKNADRTRRLTEDLWLPRVLYAGLLVLPFLHDFPLRPLACALAAVVFPLWILGLRRVVESGKFGERPDPRTSDNLRDIVYLR